jgi:23S rRNA pseudouridine1911/1915/1917 synthase
MNNFDPSSILYEDNHIIIVNKRPGQIVQGDKTGDEPMSEELSRYLAARGNKPGAAFVGVPHRIDRPVSGIALFAKTSKALERMNALFRDGGVDKIYWAIVQERPSKESAELRGYLSRNEKQNKSYISAHPKPDAKEAVLQYKLIDKSDRYFLLEILLLTGRHHQIRAQLSNEGMPIKGDLKYGAKRSNPDGSISLHARSIRFIHPVKKEEIYVEAPVPEDSLWRWFEGRAGESGNK